MTAHHHDPPTHEGLLVARAQAGDTEAFGDLVTRNQRRVWLVCRQYLGAADADTAGQDAFLKAFTRINTFDGRASFSTWLTRIAINTCLDHLRRRQREGIRVAGNEDDDEPILDRIADNSPDPEEKARQRQTVARLKRAEEDLPEGQRRIFRLRFYAEMDLEEIAKSLEVHIGTVKTQLHRAVHRLREELGGVR
ncbi:MAG: sigma-70 family RNA polymerase sigma factor [Thermoanaerobaculales bacterium]|nr:sigma-70 family RNA polymerase sigma factor [Thermoanaerobaculales bacterium]